MKSLPLICSVIVVTGLMSPAAAIALVPHSSPLPATATPRAVATASHASGDIDGDGESDLVITGEHDVRITYTSATPSGNAIQTFALPDGAAPLAVAVGDFNGDGFADVAVGSPFSLPDGPQGEEDGEIFVYYGSHSGIDPSAAVAIAGPHGKGTSFGDTLIALDLNHDGRTDLLEHNDNSGGHFVIYYGSATGLRKTGAKAFKFADVSSIATGDINGDGRPDLVIGQPDEGKKTVDDDNDVTGTEGIVSVYLGTKHGYATKPQRIHGIAAGVKYGSLGTSVAIAKVNGDKYADVVVGATGTTVSHRVESGAVVAFYGGKDGLAAKRRTVIDLATPGVPGTPRSGDDLGTDVVTGDFNGDGYADVAASAPDIDNGGSGEVLVLRGSKHGLTGHHAQLLGPKTFPGLAGPKHQADWYGAAVVAYRPHGLRYSWLAVGAPDWAPTSSFSAPYYGFVDVLRGSSSGLSTKGGQRILGPAARASYGQALGP